jgi:hypothetical protein
MGARDFKQNATIINIESSLRGGGYNMEHHAKHHIEEFGCELCALKKQVKFGDTFCVEKRPILVGVSGGTASGKTSICEII